MYFQVEQKQQQNAKKVYDLIEVSDTKLNAIEKQKNENNWNLERLIKCCFSIKNHYVKEFLAEFLGTLLLVLFGCGSVAQYRLRKEESNSNPILLTINLAFGFGLTLGILITSKISGGHLNPAVSFAALLIGKINVLQFVLYVIGQFIGSFLASLFVYLTYLDALKALPDMYTIKFASIFATYPRESLSCFGGILDQTIGTFLLITVFLAMVDKRNNTKEDGLHWSTVAFVMGLTVTLIGMSLGYNSAFAINPARDFAPRVFSCIVGWGGQVFSAGNYFFWIPIVAPFVGALIAVVFYNILINNDKDRDYELIN